MIDFSISCKMTRNLIESTSHSIVVRFNFAHFAQRRDQLSIQHKKLSFSQCRHLMMTSRFSIAIFSTIAMCTIFSFEVADLQSSINVKVFDTHHLSSWSRYQQTRNQQTKESLNYSMIRRRINMKMTRWEKTSLIILIILRYFTINSSSKNATKL